MPRDPFQVVAFRSGLQEVVVLRPTALLNGLNSRYFSNLMDAAPHIRKSLTTAKLHPDDVARLLGETRQGGAGWGGSRPQVFNCLPLKVFDLLMSNVDTARMKNKKAAVIAATASFPVARAAGYLTSRPHPLSGNLPLQQEVLRLTQELKTAKREIQRLRRQLNPSN